MRPDAGSPGSPRLIRRARLLGVALVAAFALAGTSSAGGAAPTATQFASGISASAGPSGIAAGPDGNLWFTELYGDRIGRINPATGEIDEFANGITGPMAGPAAIAAGPDGNLWFTEDRALRIGRINPGTGDIDEYTAGIDPAVDFGLAGIAAGPDGNLWFTEAGVGFGGIGRINPSSHVIDDFSTGITTGSQPKSITAGQDGNLWFTEQGPTFTGADKIGRINPATQAVTEFSSGLTNSALVEGIAAGQDGNLWFAEKNLSQIGQVRTSGILFKPTGTITEYGSGIVLTGFHSDPDGIAAGPDGNLWYPETLSNRIGRINTALDPPTFRNGTPISVPGTGSSGPADPYPSTLKVSGLAGKVITVRSVRLTGLSHTFPDDIEALLVGPEGQKVLLASDVGGGSGGAGDGEPVNGVTLNLVDSASSLPDGGPLLSGFFKPSDFAPADSFSAPAPAGPYGTSLSAFSGTSPSGNWRLFVEDDSLGDVGALHGGWGLSLETPTPKTSLGSDLIESRLGFAKFKFGSPASGMSFRCRLDKKRYKRCRSPRTYKHLSVGRHRFQVYAVDAAGKRDKSAASRSFKITG